MSHYSPAETAQFSSAVDKYHRKRRQRRLGKLTPVEFELITKPTATLAA